MADIRYVILSDLHFGAENSMLTSLTEKPATATDTGFGTDAERPTPVLSGLVGGIRELTRGQERPPTLILAGDVLDLALSLDEVCSTVYRLFAHIAFGDEPVFDPVIHYVPGNHDHHQWEVARESQYTDYVASQAPDAQLIAPWHTTGLERSAERPEASSALLTALARSQGGSAIAVRVSYPNLALRSPNGHRSLVISHGHFTESIYSLMSRLRDILYPGQRNDPPKDVAALEEENFAWIDFFWSTLGRSGQVGTDMGLIYADLTSPTDIDTLVANLVTAMLAKGKGPKFLHGPEEALLNAIFKHEANRVARSERSTPSAALSETGQAGLRDYLEGPVRNQLRQEWGEVPENLSFVYGHTHKPFVDRQSLAGFPGMVDIVNTGGWVVDTSDPNLFQAGVAVLVNDDLDTASLQFYRQTPGSSPSPVRLLDPAEGVAPSAWQTELTSRIDPAAEPWSSLAQSAADLAAQRHRLQEATVTLHDTTRAARKAK